MVLYRRFEPKDGEMVQFLAVSALRWPWESGVDPTCAFIEFEDPVMEAAPDLLAACEAALERSNQPDQAAWDSLRGMLCAAIAKAKGEV